MPAIKCAVIAAAGIGKRLGHGIPKCLVEVAGKPIFEYQLEVLKDIPEIRMIVGFEEDQVIKSVSKIRKDVVFVRNPNFQSTTTLQSFYLGCRGLQGKVLFLDGDMIISAESINQLLSMKDDSEFIGVASDISDDPVYAQVENNKLVGFSFTEESPYEWANMAYIDCQKLEYNNTHFFVQLEKFLPQKIFNIKRLEVDTFEDLEHANKVITKFHNLSY